MKLSLAAILLMLMLASGISSGADNGSRSEVYRWKDGAGVVHYSDTPPTQFSFTRMRLASSLTNAVVDPAPQPGRVAAAASADRVGASTVVGADTAGGVAASAAAYPKAVEEPSLETTRP